MATRDLKGLTIEIGGDMSNLTDSLKGVDKELSSLQANLRTVQSALRLDPGNVSALTQQQSLLTDAVAATSQRLDQLREAQRQVDAQIANGVDVDQRAYRSLQAEIVRTEASLNDYETQAREVNNQLEEQAREAELSETAFGRLRLALNNAGDSAEDAGNDADKSGEGWTVVKDVISDLASEAIQAAVEAFKELLIEGELALDMLQARLGVSESAMRKYGDVAEEVFENGFGDSITDVAQSIGTVTEMLGDLDETELQNVTENALTLRDVYGWDVKESIRAVNSLMKQFGITSDEAYNLIVQGAQNGLDQNGDLLDTINEYSVQFGDAGYSAEDMFNMIANGADEGTWSIDKMGDAIKEYNIRVSDGTVVDALRENADLLGITEMEAVGLGRAFGQSGREGKDAMNEVLGVIMGVENEMLRYQLGVAVFGTMWEDLGEDAVVALMNTEGGITATNEAMAQMKTDAYDNLATSVTTLGRTLKSELLNPIVEEISPVVQGAITWMIDNIDILRPVILAVGVAFGVFTTAVIALKVAVAALNAVMNSNPIFLAATAIIAVIAGIATAIASMETATEKSTKTIKANAEAVTSFSDAVAAAQPNILDTTEILSAYGNTLADIDTEISNTENAITEILSTALAEQRTLREDELASIAAYNEELARLNEERLGMYRQVLTVELMKIGAESNAMSQEQMAQYQANLDKAYEDANTAAEEHYSNQLTDVYNYHQAQGTLHSEAYYADVEAAKAAHDAELAENQRFYDEGMDALQVHANYWVTTDAEKWNAVVANVDSSTKKYSGALDEIDLDTANAFLSMYATTVAKGGEISDETKNIATVMIAAFDGLDGDMADIGKEALLGMITGLEDEIPGLENASEMTAQEIVDVLKDYLEINSPSRVTNRIGKDVSAGLQNGMSESETAVGNAAASIASAVVSGFESENSEMSGIGEDMVEGLESGISSKKSWIGTKISTFASGLVSGFKNAFRIASPSRLMRDEIGAMLAEGIGVGIAENEDAALDPMQDLKDELTAFDGVSVSKSINASANGSQRDVSRLVEQIGELRALVSEFLPHIAANSTKHIYLDKSRLVGSMAADMDEALGEIAERKAVGAV